MHGKGVLRQRGATYRGNFLEDRFHGKGRLEFPNGDAYAGAFRDHAFHGAASRAFLFEDAAFEAGGPPKTKGPSVSRRRRGGDRPGRVAGDADRPTSIDSSPRRRRRWRRREWSFAGKGKFTWKSGKTYEGAFDRGKLTGQGVYTWPEGQRYEGPYLDGKRHGRGELGGAYGQHYEGDFHRGVVHGDGIFTSANSEFVEGTFVAGRFVPDD